MKSKSAWSTDQVGGFCIALASGFLLGWLWGTKPAGLADTDWLAVMTAVGTVGATVAAVAVPMYQNWERRREQRVNDLLVQWAIAEEVHRLSAKVRDAAESLFCLQTVPSLVGVQHLYSQLEISKQRTLDRFGALIIGDLLQLTTIILAEGERRVNMSRNAMTMSIGAGARLQGGLRSELERADQLHESTYRWMDRILFQLKQLNFVPPFLVKGEGTAAMSLEARSSD